MPDDLDQKRNDLTVKEAIHRADVISYAQESLESIPEEDEEARTEQRDKLLEQAEHYKRLMDGILDVITKDLER